MDYSKHTYALMEDKMAAGAFARARNYGCDEKQLNVMLKPQLIIIIMINTVDKYPYKCS